MVRAASAEKYSEPLNNWQRTPLIIYSITKMAIHVLEMSFVKMCEAKIHVSLLVIEVADAMYFGSLRFIKYVHLK